MDKSSFLKRAVISTYEIRVRDVQLARAPSDIGQSVTGRAETFIDMTRGPAKCGGWPSVIKAFGRCDRMDVGMIIRRLNRKGTLIEKARMGFLLERFGLVDGAPDEWVAALHRGGSMKLHATAPFLPVLSERWKLSVNVSELL